VKVSMLRRTGSRDFCMLNGSLSKKASCQEALGIAVRGYVIVPGGKQHYW
jgi:hypothetical protein